MSFSRVPLHLAVVALFAFAGGFVAQKVGGPIAAWAQESANQSFVAITDAKNTKGINSYVSDGQPGQVFYGENGNMRLQMGTYNGAGERGLPLMALSDTKGHIRLLMRLAGGNESPVIVMKDKNGSDRLVMGLGLSDDGQEPFLSVTDKDGKATNVFGTYR